MKKGFIIVTLVASLSFSMFQQSTVADAVTTKVTRTSRDSSEEYSTNTTLSVRTNITLEVPINPFAEDSARSKGSSNTSYSNHGGNKIKRTLTDHKITAKITGIGSGTITCPSGAEVSYSGSMATYSCKSWDWSYSIYSDILAIYGYRETHSLNYQIKKTNGNKSSKNITLGATVKA